MKIVLSTLAENTTGSLQLLAEWGLSLVVEVDGFTVLVDAGRTMVAAHNADQMKTDLHDIEAILLSHGHEDHTGGLPELLKLRNQPDRPVRVIAHPDIWVPKFKRSGDGLRHDAIGIPFTREAAERLGAEFHLSADPVWLTDRIVTSGEVPMRNDFERIDATACVAHGEGYCADPLRDDQSLFIKSDSGLIVVSGCAHRGILNTIRHGQELTGLETVYAVVGGIHLYSADGARIERTIDEFRRLDIQRIGVSHCTGQAASVRLAQEFGERFFFNSAGTRTTFEV